VRVPPVTSNGTVAQEDERLGGNAEVEGAIPQKVPLGARAPVRAPDHLEVMPSSHGGRGGFDPLGAYVLLG
jgi:hypothetical protein